MRLVGQSSTESSRLFGGGEKNKKSIGSLKEGSTHRLCAPGRSLSRIRQPQGLNLQDKVKEYRGLTLTVISVDLRKPHTFQDFHLCQARRRQRKK